MNEIKNPIEEGKDPSEKALSSRVEDLEKGIQVWRCLAAAGFLTAIGAFGLAVFGLSQLQNTYFHGEVVSNSAEESRPLLSLGKTDPFTFPEQAGTPLVFSMAEETSDKTPGRAMLPDKPSPLLSAPGTERPFAATEGGS